MTVTLDDIAVRLGRAAPLAGTIEARQWQSLIDDALLLIGARLGDVALLDQAKLDYVVREAVVAHVRNPDDATQVDVAVDDARVSRRYSSSSGRVVILDDWWDLLSPAAGDRGVATFRPSFSPDGGYEWVTTTAATWVP